MTKPSSIPVPSLLVSLAISKHVAFSIQAQRMDTSTTPAQYIAPT